MSASLPHCPLPSFFNLRTQPKDQQCSSLKTFSPMLEPPKHPHLPLSGHWALYLCTVHMAIIGCCRGLNEKWTQSLSHSGIGFQLSMLFERFRRSGLAGGSKSSLGVGFESLKLQLLPSSLWVCGSRLISHLPVPAIIESSPLDLNPN